MKVKTRTLKRDRIPLILATAFHLLLAAYTMVLAQGSQDSFYYLGASSGGLLTVGAGTSGEQHVGLGADYLPPSGSSTATGNMIRTVLPMVVITAAIYLLFFKAEGAKEYIIVIVTTLVVVSIIEAVANIMW